MALYIGQATSLTLKTLPYIFLRFAVYSLFGLLFCVYWTIVYFIGQAFGPAHETGRAIVWIAAFVLPFPLLRFIREYLLYIVKAGHVAVLAELAMRGKLPEGVGQIQWGKQKVQKTFKETSALFLVDRLVAGVIGAINGMMWRIGNLFSGIPGVQGLVKFANIILRFSLTYVDEAILARNFVMEKESIWESSRVGLILYAQIWRQVLGTAFVLGLASILIYGALGIVLVVPALGLAQTVTTGKFIFVIVAIVLAFVIKLTFFDPWTLSNMILTYLNETKNLVPNKEWESKLEALSGKFKQIQQKAVSQPQVTG